MAVSSNLRILIVAEHAAVSLGGEAFLPLHYFRLLRARGIEAWLVCHERVKRELCEAFPNDKDRLFFVEDSATHRALWQVSRRIPHRIEGVTSGALSHLLTQLMQRDVVKQLVKTHAIDVVHEPIPVSPKQPSAMFDVGAPVVIGPLNGGMTYPKGFKHIENKLQRLSLRAARVASSTMNYMIPGKAKAALLLVANERTRRALPKSVAHVRCVELVENGVDLSRFGNIVRSPKRDGRTRFAFVGRLVDWKAIDLLLEALADVSRDHDATLEIFGDGEERDSLKRLTAKLGLGARVAFHGFVPQVELPSRLAEVDVLVLPSLAECGGAVVLEAMALSLPVIATRWGGPADYLDDSCGILVDPLSREQLIRDLSKAMRTLASSPETRERLASAGRAKVIAHYNWERKIDALLGLYAEVAKRS